MPGKQEVAARAISRARALFAKGQHEQGLVACDRAIRADPGACEAYMLRWLVLAEILDPDEARRTRDREVEAFLACRADSPDVLLAAYWGYMGSSTSTESVPDSLFERMLEHPGTDAMLIALLGLAERSQDRRKKWECNRRVIDGFTASGTSYLRQYLGAHQDMLRLAEQDRRLASAAYLDELIERCLETFLTYCRTTQHAPLWAYRESVDFRIRLGIGLGRALEVLARAEAYLRDKVEQQRYGDPGGSPELPLRDFARLRAKICVEQEQWRQARRALSATMPKQFGQLSTRFGEDTIERFFLLGRAAEGLHQLDRASRHYVDAHCAPRSHPEALAGLRRVYRIQHGSLRGFTSSLRTAEAEYRTREHREREKIRRRLVREKMNRAMPDLRLESLDRQPFRLSDMRGAVVLFDVWATWCDWCHRALPQLEAVYEHFLDADEVEILGVNNGESPDEAAALPAEHQPPWPILLDPACKVSKACEIGGIPCFILIDEEGRWQYKVVGYGEWLAQELIWLIDELRGPR